MVLGTVKWFGGSTKEGRKNNFGFLHYINEETGTQEEIYINRSEVPIHLQELLETDLRQGEGIYVEFDILTNGKKKATNLKLHRILGTVIFFSKGRGYIQCPDRSKDVYFSSQDQFYENDVLYFGVQYNSKFQNEQAIDVKQCDSLESDEELIKLCASHSEYKIYAPFFIRYISTISEQEAVIYLIDKINLLSLEKQEKIISKVYRNLENLLLLSERLRRFLPQSKNDYAQFLNQHLNSTDEQLREKLLSELVCYFQQCTDSEKQYLWQQVNYLENNLEYHGKYWDIAPIEYQNLTSINSSAGILLALLCCKQNACLHSDL